MRLLEDFFAEKTVFKKKTKNRYTDGEYFIIFYHSPKTEIVRMYIVDLKTNKHLQTHYYNFRGYRKCINFVKIDIKKLIKSKPSPYDF
jgi:hypothetical protein